MNTFTSMAFTSVKVTPAGSINSITEGFQFGTAFVNGIGLQRSYNNNITISTTTVTVLLPIAEPDTNYALQVEGTFSATNTIWVTSKSVSAFALAWTTSINNSVSSYDWILVR